MSKAEETKSPAKKSNISFIKVASDNPSAIEDVVNNYLGAPGNPVGNKPLLRKEVYFYGLGVAEKDLDVIYSKTAPTKEKYNEIPKYYKDKKGNIKPFNDGQDLKDLAKQYTDVFSEIAKHSSDIYPLKRAQQIANLVDNSFQSLLKAVGREAMQQNLDNLLDKPNPLTSDYTFANVGADYQRTLNAFKAFLPQFEKAAKILAKTKPIAFSSEIGINSEGPTNQDMTSAFSKTILDQKNITGLDPKDPDFKLKLNEIDPSTIKDIELVFKISPTEYKTSKIAASKYLEALKALDPKVFPDKDYSELEREERNLAKDAIAKTFNEAKIYENGLITERFKYDSISRPKPLSFATKSQKTSPAQSSENPRISIRKTKEISKTQLNNKDRIVFADEAQSILAERDKIKYATKQKTNTIENEQIKTDKAKPNFLRALYEQAKNLTKSKITNTSKVENPQEPLPHVVVSNQTGRAQELEVSKSSVNIPKGLETLQTATPSHQSLKRTEAYRQLPIENVTKSQSTVEQTSAINQPTKKPLPTSPAIKPSPPPRTKKPLPPTPLKQSNSSKEAQAFENAQAVLKSEMKLQPGRKVNTPIINKKIEIAGHRDQGGLQGARKPPGQHNTR